MVGRAAAGPRPVAPPPAWRRGPGVARRHLHPDRGTTSAPARQRLATGETRPPWHPRRVRAGARPRRVHPRRAARTRGPTQTRRGSYSQTPHGWEYVAPAEQPPPRRPGRAPRHGACTAVAAASGGDGPLATTRRGRGGQKSVVSLPPAAPTDAGTGRRPRPARRRRSGGGRPHPTRPPASADRGNGARPSGPRGAHAVAVWEGEQPKFIGSCKA